MAWLTQVSCSPFQRHFEYNVLVIRNDDFCKASPARVQLEFVSYLRLVDENLAREDCVDTSTRTHEPILQKNLGKVATWWLHERKTKKPRF